MYREAQLEQDVIYQQFNNVPPETPPTHYLEGSGYRDAESFLDPPIDSVEYIAFIDHRPAALITLIQLATVPRVYQAGLITNPEASLRKICKLLQEFMGAVFDAMAQALFVDFPDSPEFSKTRKLARFFGLKQTSDTIFLQTRTDHGNTKRPEADAELDDQLPRRVYDRASDGGGTGAQGLPV